MKWVCPRALELDVEEGVPKGPRADIDVYPSTWLGWVFTVHRRIYHAELSKTP